MSVSSDRIFAQSQCCRRSSSGAYPWRGERGRTRRRRRKRERGSVVRLRNAQCSALARSLGVWRRRACCEAVEGGVRKMSSMQQDAEKKEVVKCAFRDFVWDGQIKLKSVWVCPCVCMCVYLRIISNIYIYTYRNMRWYRICVFSYLHWTHAYLTHAEGIWHGLLKYACEIMQLYFLRAQCMYAYVLYLYLKQH